jgi:hypothetical protein
MPISWLATRTAACQHAHSNVTCYNSVTHQEVWLLCQDSVQAEGLDAEQLVDRHAAVGALNDLCRLVDGLRYCNPGGRSHVQGSEITHRVFASMTLGPQLPAYITVRSLLAAVIWHYSVKYA